MTTEQQEELKELSEFIKHLQDFPTYKISSRYEGKENRFVLGNNQREYLLPKRICIGLDKTKIAEGLNTSLSAIFDPLIAKAKEGMKTIIDNS